MSDNSFWVFAGKAAIWLLVASVVIPMLLVAGGFVFTMFMIQEIAK